MIISSAFGQMEAIDVTAPSVEFDLASLVGRMVGSQRCKTIYSRCAVSPDAIMEGIRKVAFAKSNSTLGAVTSMASICPKALLMIISSS